MVWNKNDYPDSMKNLDEKVRDKAIEIGNELLDNDYSESRAIPIAIEKAKEWTNEKEASKQDSSTNTPSNIYHLAPNGDKWEIKKENTERASFTFDTKKEARDKVNDMLNDIAESVVIHRKDGTIEDTLTTKK